MEGLILIAALVFGAMWYFGKRWNSQDNEEVILKQIAEDAEPTQATLPPLQPGSLLRATIDHVASTGLQVTIQLSDEARKVINKGLWNYSLGEIHNWYYNYEVKKYNEAWMRYEIYQQSDSIKVRSQVEKPTLPKPNKTRPVLIKEICNPKGYTCYFDTASDAKAGAEQIRKMLQLLKSFIEDNQAPQQKLTFDL